MAIDKEERTSAKQQPVADSAQSNTTSVDVAESSSSGNKKALTTVLVIVGVLIVLGVLASTAAGFLFDKTAERVIESATNSKIDIDSGDGTGEVTIEGDNGRAAKFTTETEIPDGFPEAVPLYEGAKVVSAQTTTITDEGANYSVIFETDDSLEEVDDFYADALSTEGGWNITSRIATSENIQLMAANDSKGLMLILGVETGSEAGKTEITVITRNHTEK